VGPPAAVGCNRTGANRRRDEEQEVSATAGRGQHIVAQTVPSFSDK